MEYCQPLYKAFYIYFTITLSSEYPFKVNHIILKYHFIDKGVNA